MGSPVTAMTDEKRKVELQDLADRAVGQTETECRTTVKQRGFVLRVSRRNGRPSRIRWTSCPDRITVSVNNGIVTEARIG